VSIPDPAIPLPNEPIGGVPIAGFLGSGKTTLLNRLLRHPRDERHIGGAALEKSFRAAIAG